MVIPYKEKDSGKKEQVAEMFDHVSNKYDLLNALFSLGIDSFWRKKAIRLLSDVNSTRHLDIACGTGDFAIEALKLNPEKVSGIDISKGMIAEGQKKIAKKGLEHVIDLKYGDAENMLFADHTFDTITVGFGVRNFEDLEQGLSEIRRVLQPNGKVAILELSNPRVFPIKQLYDFYSFTIVPFLGWLIAKDKPAYVYLPKSIREFPDGERFLSILRKVGFKKTSQKRMMFGIVSIYIAGN